MRRTMVRLLVGALCAAALLQAMRPTVYSARVGFQLVRRSGADSADRFYREQLEYLGAELHRRLPAGTRITIKEDDAGYRLRLAELATMDGLIVVDAGADLEVRLQLDPAAPHGVRLFTAEPAS